MKIQLQVAVTSVLFMICIQQITCEQVSNSSGTKWTCTCSSYQENQRSINADNCSTSCDCLPVNVGSIGNTWTCVCNSGELPTLAADGQNSNCFTGCDCTSGSISSSQAPSKHFSNRVVIILFVSLVFITLALIVSLICFFYSRDKNEQQKTLSDRGSSLESTTDLIKHKFPSQSPARSNVGLMESPLTPFTGCIGSLLFRRKTKLIHGTVTHFTYSELEHATNKFSHDNLIGVGGCSYVYRGHLKDGRTIAVKRLKASMGLDSDSEFFKEVEIISRLHHCHIVPLLGYCSISLGKQIERLLIFENLPNGNLRDCLDGPKHLDWDTRVAIALGAARGLEYLHDAAAPRIFHRDVKSTNILLDENWKAKVTDLGMAKCLSNDGFLSCSSSPERIQGTFGYFAPEYAIVGKGSLKSDVFSFGVVLLELITGRTPIFNVSDKGDESLVIWAAPRLQDSRRVISELPDPNLKGNFPEEEMQIMAYLAKECLLLDPECRPSMSEVVQVLSTLAPNVSRRRRFPTNLFQNLSSNSMKSEPCMEKSTSQVEVLVDSEELKQMCPSRWSSRCSLSSDIDRTLLADSIGKSVNLSSVQCINSLLYLTSSGSHSTNGKDDEIVDLTEPRLESFCVGNDQ